MKVSTRHPAPRALAALLALSLFGSLFGCLDGQPRLAMQAARPNPPPIPLRKPTPPVVRSAPVTAAPVEVRAVSRGVTQAVTPAPITTASLAPPQKYRAPAKPAVGIVTYRVQARDTVYGVARRFAVPARGVIDQNRLASPYALRVGQILRIPNPRRHVVGPGDTIYGVSRRYGADPSRLVRLNAIAPPYIISLGQTLILPVDGGAVASTVSAARARPVARPVARLVARTAARTATQWATQRATPKAGPPPIRRVATTIPKLPLRAGGKFLWPVRGRLINSYGRKKNGLHNDGINIAAPRGAPVRAAENGIVAYLGNELRGFGNLILIRHAGGWITAYAHNEGFLVRRGDRVKRGQIIARIGSSGSVATPQLHFEIRKNARSIDPMRLLGPRLAAAN